MKALVTGGGGFLGTRIVEMLHDRGDVVVAIGRRRYAHLESKGIKTLQGDLRDPDVAYSACRGMDAVFHAAALAGIWGPRELFWDINVVATQNIITGCRRQGVAKLIYTSSPSVVFSEEDLCGVDESVPYPKTHLAHYPATKAEAERRVRGSSGPTLTTVALRPHLIWGPADPHLIPRIVQRARQRRLWQVGEGDNLVDITYIDNAAEAHLMACDALSSDPGVSGRVYFLSQGQPVRLWAWVNQLLEHLGVPRVTRTMSYDTARRLGGTLEAIYKTLRIKTEPRMTRFLAAQLARSHYFDISAARRDLGYAPRISTEEGMQRLLQSLAS